MVQGVTDNNALQPFRHPDRNAFPDHLDLTMSLYWGENNRNTPQRGTGAMDRFEYRLQGYRGKGILPEQDVVQKVEHRIEARTKGESANQIRKDPRKSSSREVNK